MNLLKKLSLATAAAAFLLSLSVAAAYAQPGRAGWRNNNGRARGWYQGQRNGWNRGRKNGWRNRGWGNNNVYYGDRDYQTRYYSYGRLSPREYYRLQRQRSRIYNNRNRYYSNDGYISGRERRRLQRQYNRYQRNVYRDRRDW
jgi:hypothetical protein